MKITILCIIFIFCAWVTKTQAQEMHLELSIGNVIDNIVGIGQLDKVNYRFDGNDGLYFSGAVNFSYTYKKVFLLRTGLSYYHDYASFSVQRNDTICPTFCHELEIRGGGYSIRTLRIPLLISFDVLRKRNLSLFVGGGINTTFRSTSDIDGGISPNSDKYLENEAMLALGDGFRKTYVNYVLNATLIFKDRYFINITRMPNHSKYGRTIDFKGKTYPNLISQKYTEVSLGFRFRLNPEKE